MTEPELDTPQYWRLAAHHLAFSNSSDLFVAELVLYNVGVQVERQFGSIKFAVSPAHWSKLESPDRFIVIRSCDNIIGHYFRILDADIVSSCRP